MYGERIVLGFLLVLGFLGGKGSRLVGWLIGWFVGWLTADLTKIWRRASARSNTRLKCAEKPGPTSFKLSSTSSFQRLSSKLTTTLEGPSQIDAIQRLAFCRHRFRGCRSALEASSAGEEPAAHPREEHVVGLRE